MERIIDSQILSGRSLRRIAVFGLVLVCFFGIQVVLAEVVSKKPDLPNDGLRGVYYGTEKQDPTINRIDRIGKLAIEISQGSTSETVRVDHSFRTGDKFRFKVSCNRDGWLYILHRSASEKLGLLWPRLAADNEDSYLDMNKINAGRTYTVPESPGIFIFDNEVEAEYFYVVVAAEKKIPQLTALGATRHEITASTEDNGKSKRIVNFGIRSGTAATAESLRGVLYDPGLKDSDPYLYFTTPSGDDNRQAIIEFQLKHQ